MDEVQFLKLFTTAWTQKSQPQIEEHVNDTYSFKTPDVGSARKKGRPRKMSRVSSSALEIDEAGITWGIGKAVGMIVDNSGSILNVLRRSQRRGVHTVT